MYAGDNLYLNSQVNAKSSLQALLRAREQVPANQSISGNSQELSGLLNSSTSCLNQVPLADNYSFATETALLHPESHLQNTSPENLDNRKDFNYSQKLFHISDGNLYSIFSPIHGRSYGMKPSFLRKQKYTVQECKNRGHKNLRKGLKFHNFLPSESVTSEKDSGYLAKWKVHSECRLQEEHGTKQITISNWSQSIQNSPSEQSSINSETKVLNGSSYSDYCFDKYSLNKQNKDFTANLHSSNQNFNVITDNEHIKNSSIIDKDTYAFDSSSSISQCDDKLSSSNLHDTLIRVNKNSECFTSRKSILDNVLSSLKSSSSVNGKIECDEIEFNSKNELDSQKHRRKPVCTRRIVPYTKYLSLIEESHSAPLDLSSKYPPQSDSSPACFSENAISKPVTLQSFTCKNIPMDSVRFKKKVRSRQPLNYNEQFLPLKKGQNTTTDSIDIINKTSISPFHNNVNTSSPYSSPIVQSVATHGLWPQPELKDKFSRSFEASKKPNFSSTPQDIASCSTLKSQLNNMHYTLQKPFVKESRAKARRRSQRSVIKQKLEDTFKQNGFLVKTKQVSDGEATFCKFRQLRKYTRYYLKSWQQHLPDEVHKMWKGFLPPKTVMPPVPNLPEQDRDPT